MLAEGSASGRWILTKDQFFEQLWMRLFPESFVIRTTSELRLVCHSLALEETPTSSNLEDGELLESDLKTIVPLLLELGVVLKSDEDFFVLEEWWQDHPEARLRWGIWARRIRPWVQRMFDMQCIPKQWIPQLLKQMAQSPESAAELLNSLPQEKIIFDLPGASAEDLRTFMEAIETLIKKSSGDFVERSVSADIEFTTEGSKDFKQAWSAWTHRDPSCLIGSWGWSEFQPQTVKISDEQTEQTPWELNPTAANLNHVTQSNGFQILEFENEWEEALGALAQLKKWNQQGVPWDEMEIVHPFPSRVKSLLGNLCRQEGVPWNDSCFKKTWIQDGDVQKVVAYLKFKYSPDSASWSFMESEKLLNVSSEHIHAFFSSLKTCGEFRQRLNHLVANGFFGSMRSHNWKNLKGQSLGLTNLVVVSDVLEDLSSSKKLERESHLSSPLTWIEFIETHQDILLSSVRDEIVNLFQNWAVQLPDNLKARADQWVTFLEDQLQETGPSAPLVVGGSALKISSLEGFLGSSRQKAIWIMGLTDENMRARSQDIISSKDRRDLARERGISLDDRETQSRRHALDLLLASTWERLFLSISRQDSEGSPQQVYPGILRRDEVKL